MATHKQSEELHQAYKDEGLVVIGIHSPEFAYEKKLWAVMEVVQSYGLTFPIALDNDFQTWKAYKNKYWPSFYLIDAHGMVRSAHFGKGRAHEIEKTIQKLLAEKSKPQQEKISDIEQQSRETKQQEFKRYNLNTNTANSEIPLQKVLDGGPGKDGIPAINDPIFITQKEAGRQMKYLSKDSQWIVVSQWEVHRFYPYEILVWHEIVNDSIWDNHFSVTFCPLCGSAIVYDREVSGRLVNFWVSGKLYQSNLLMYDDHDETLWSQWMGRALVWDQRGTKLEMIASHLMSYGDFQSYYETGEVLSDATGHRRAYGVIPYWDYDESERFYFPVENADDVRFHPKKLFYIINDGERSLAFAWDELVQQKSAQLQLWDDQYKAEFAKGKASVVKNNSQEEIPGYMEMWFSWIHHNQNSKNVWSQ